MSDSQGGKGNEEGTPKKFKLKRGLQMGEDSPLRAAQGVGPHLQSQAAQLALAAPASATGAAEIDLALPKPPPAVPPPKKSAAADPATGHDPTATAAVPPPPSAAVAQTALQISPCKESWAWEYFDPAPGEAKTPRTKAVHVKCKICGAILSRGMRRSTTTSMLRHLRTMHEITGPATATSEPAKKKKKTGSSQKHSGSSGTGSKVPSKSTSKGGQQSSADASKKISGTERHLSNDFFPQVCNICHVSVPGGSTYNSIERGDARVAHMRQYHASEWQKFLKNS